VVRSRLRSRVNSLAGCAERLGAVFAVFNGGVFLAALAHHVVWISMILAQRGRSSRCSTQHGSGKVVDGKRIDRFLTLGVAGVGGGNLKDSAAQWASKWRLAYSTKGVKGLIVLVIIYFD